jgi:hypothetical protein
MAEQITAGKLAEEVRNILSGGSMKPEVIPSRRQALLAVQQARNKVVADYLWLMKRMGEMTVPFELIDEKAVSLKDYKDGISYIELENRVMSNLPNGVGLYELTTDEMPPTEIIRVTPSHLTLYQNQDSADMGGDPFYIPVKNILYVYNLNGKDCDLNMRAIFAGEAYNETEFFCISPDMEGDIVNGAISILGLIQEIPEDRITDNTKS